MAEVRHTEVRAELRGADVRSARSIPDLVTELGRDVSSLVSKEAGLLRAEVSEKLSNLQTAGGSLAAAGICLLVSLLILLQALIVALTNLGLGAGWASLLVGLAVGIIGVVLLQQGRSLLGEGILPKRTQTQVQRDAEMLKEQVK
ncbi:MAG: phage holin family protein [Hyphomicrobiaceae bacterium]|nr:phage holin family protein [Hyphomicrobiaceae bacterium]